MRGQLSLKADITVEEAHGRIHAAIEQHKNTIRLHRSTISVLEAVLKELKADSLVHQTYIRALNSQHNDYTPISRLPPEVLCTIFSFAQRDKSGDMLPYSEWTRFTHVSRYWRNVSVNSPSLWTEIHPRNHRWVNEAVRRSKNAGLVFSIAGSSREHRNGLHYALHFMSRVRGLRIIDNPSLYVWNIIHHALAQSRPRLEFLALTCVHATTLYQSTFKHPMPAFLNPSPSDRVLRATMRRLRNLRLVESHVNWESPLFFQSAITHLTLQDSVSKPTWKQFILAMQKMPDLEYLTLDNIFLIADHTSVPEWTPQDHIQFTHLRALHILSETPREIEGFFHLITFPPDAVVKVECFAELSSIEFSRIVMGLSKSYSTRLCDPHFRTFVITRCDYSDGTSGIWLALSMATYPNQELICGDLADANLQLEFSWGKQLLDGLCIKPFLDTVFAGSLPLQHIQRVFLNLDPEDEGINAEILLTTFGKLPEVDSIITGSRASKPFVDAIELGLTAQDTAPVGLVAPLYFPKLSSICFHSARISNSKSAPNPISVPVELLQKCLVRRYKCGAEIPNVSFRACHGLGRWETVYSLEEGLVGAVREATRVHPHLPALEQNI